DHYRSCEGYRGAAGPPAVTAIWALNTARLVRNLLVRMFVCSWVQCRLGSGALPSRCIIATEKFAEPLGWTMIVGRWESTREGPAGPSATAINMFLSYAHDPPRPGHLPGRRSVLSTGRSLWQPL